MADLIAAADAQGYLSVKAGTDDALFARLVSAASAAVEQFCGRTFAQAAYVEQYDGRGRDALLLRNGPVTAVASVSVDGVGIPQRPGVGQRGWTLFDAKLGILRLAGACFTRGVQNVEVSYTAGYAATPPDVVQCVIDLVALKYRQREKVGKLSEAVGDQTTTYAFGRLPADVQATLQPHVRVVCP